MHIHYDPLPFHSHDATGPEASALALPPVREPDEEGIYPEDDPTDEVPALSGQPWTYTTAHPLHAEFVMVAQAHAEACDEHLNAVVFGDANAAELGRRADQLWNRLLVLRGRMNGGE